MNRRAKIVTMWRYVSRRNTKQLAGGIAMLAAALSIVACSGGKESPGLTTVEELAVLETVSLDIDGMT